MKFILECDGIDKGEGCDPVPNEICIKTSVGEIHAERALLNCLIPFEKRIEYEMRVCRDNATKVYVKLCEMQSTDLIQIFGHQFPDDIIIRYSLDQIEEKLVKYDDTRKIHPGDGVISKLTNEHGIVLDVKDVEGDYAEMKQYLIWYKNGAAGWFLRETFRADGKHYPLAESLHEEFTNEM